MLKSSLNRSTAITDACIFLLLALSISLLFYHPYYFGDELFSFGFGAHSGGSFFNVFNELNAYKPRVVMNVLWAAIVAADLPRWVPMVVSAVAMAACAVLVYGLGIRHLDAPRPAAMLAGMLVLLSRFNVMLYFDYVSGTVETLSLAFFLAGIALAANSLLRNGTDPVWKLVASGASFVLAVLVHERFAAGLVGLTAVSCLVRLPAVVKERSLRRLVFPVTIAVLPLAVFVALVKSLSDKPLTMGTSGQTVQFGTENLYVAATYIGNVFFGGNHGPPWFVGMLNQSHPWATTVFWVSGATLAAAWILPWVLKRRGAEPTALSAPAYQAGAAFFAAAIGMILIASLPGASRQEARWMFPVSVLVVLMVLALYRGGARYFLLAMLVASHAFYLQFGTVGAIASITASRTAQLFGDALDAVDLPGESGLVMAAPEPDTSWVLGGDGEAFCRVNLAPGNCLYTKAAYDSGVARDYGYGLIPTPNARDGSPSYRFIAKSEVAILLDPTALPATGEVLGGAAGWGDWKLDDRGQLVGGGLLLSRLAENFVRVDADRLDGAFLTYRAAAVEGGTVSMRMQVNWHDSQDKFIDAYLDVVPVGPGPQDYTAMLIAPQGAVYGYVYASLHDGAKGKVLIESVRLVSLAKETVPVPVEKKLQAQGR